MSYTLKEIDKLEIFVLMDNISDPFTKSHDGMRWNEFQYQFDVRQQLEMSGANMCRACNGLSLLIKIHAENKVYNLLFDTGPDDGLVVDNAKKLGLDLTTIDAIMLSHGHFDHFGGTLSLLDAVGKKDINVYVHPELFVPRAFNRKSLIKVGNNLTRENVIKHGGQIIEDTNPTLLFDNFALITGEVPRNTSYETGTPSECRLINNEWVNSPEVIDERCLILNLKNKGICVFTGCGHTGVVNAVQHAQQLSNISKVHLVMGGFHLAGPSFHNRILPTVKDLKTINPDYIVTGHCTGRQAQSELSKMFADKHIPYGVGTVFQF